MNVRTIRLLVMAAGICAGCASERPVHPAKPMSSAKQEMGYRDAIDLGAQYVAENGYPGAQVQSARQVQPNLWVVRFGVAPQGSGRMVDVYIEGNQRRLMKVEELNSASARAKEAPP